MYFDLDAWVYEMYMAKLMCVSEERDRGWKWKRAVFGQAHSY